MTENRFSQTGGLKEAVCISAMRVFDSCRARECAKNLRVRLREEDQPLVDSARSVRLRSAEIADTIAEVEPVPFKQGYYCVRIRFYFIVDLELNVQNEQCLVSGLCEFEKKAVLFGGENSTRIFTSGADGDSGEQSCAPVAVCQLAQPVCLGAEITQSRGCSRLTALPERVERRFGCKPAEQSGELDITVTLGLFMVLRLERTVQLIVPTFELILPEKPCCVEQSASPCDVFSKIAFPTEQFIPRMPCIKE